MDSGYRVDEFGRRRNQKLLRSYRLVARAAGRTFAPRLCGRAEFEPRIPGNRTPAALRRFKLGCPLW